MRLCHKTAAQLAVLTSTQVLEAWTPLSALNPFALSILTKFKTAVMASSTDHLWPRKKRITLVLARALAKVSLRKSLQFSVLTLTSRFKCGSQVDN